MQGTGRKGKIYVYATIVRKTMSRNKFEKIKRHFYFSDNENLSARYKAAKVRQLFEEGSDPARMFGGGATERKIVKKLCLFLIKSNEQVVSYFGHHFSAFWFQTVDTRTV